MKTQHNTAQVLDRSAEEASIRSLLVRYLDAVRSNDQGGLRATFHPDANIAHYYVKGDEVKTIDVEAFLGVIRSLHEKYDNAEEVANDIEISFVGPLASVRVAFSFVMGPNARSGEDLFNLACCKGEWVIIHKSYYL